MARILIAGCGEVGVALGAMLFARGHEVWGLRRDGTKQMSPLRVVQADLASPASLQAIPEALDFVFYLASADCASDASYSTTYVRNLQNLLDVLHARSEKPSCIFYASSTSVYAQANDEWIDEDSPTQPEHFAGKRLLEGEALLHASNFPFCIVRFSGIYSVKKRALFERVLHGEVEQVEHSPYTNRIHLDDCAGVLAFLVDLPKPAQLYLASDSEPARRSDVEKWLVSEIERRKNIQNNFVSNYESADKIKTAATDLVHTPRRRSSSKRCSNLRLKKAGYVFRYPSFREGYAAILDQMATQWRMKNQGDA